MIEKFNNILKEYQDDFKRIKGIIKYRFKGYIKSFKESLKEPKNRQKYLLMASSFVFLILFANIYNSYGYYNDISTIPIIHAKVGNFSLSNYDYTLLVYLENGTKDGTYHLAHNIPTSGYKYKEYSCINNSTLDYDDNLYTTNVTLKKKDVCSIYFDLINEPDITLNIMLETKPESETYNLSDFIPSFGYVYSHYECKNSDSVLNYDSSLHKVTVSSSKKESCNVYFNKLKSDIEVVLFTESFVGSQKYVEMASIPPNATYHLNKESSYCENTKNERNNDNITYQDGYIEITSEEILSCKVYLDKDE